MKKFLFLRMLFVAFSLIFFVTSTYASGDFKEFYNKGIDFYKQGKYDQAGQEFKKAIELKPNDVYALYGLGNTYYCKAKYDDAVKIYAKAININPDYAKVHYSLSLAYSKLGMTREAEKQKTLFRKLSQGGKSSDSSTHAKASHTSSHAKADHSPKKTLSTAPKKTLHEPNTDTHKTLDTHAASRHEPKHDTHAASKHEPKLDTHAASKHEPKHDTHAANKHETKHDTHAVSRHEPKHDTHASSKHETKHDTHASAHDSGGDSHTIFQGFSGETHKADERVFHKKESHGTYSSAKPFSTAK
ncbi:MAG: tetratricopeptide repeat protein, partial [Candidatus Brocadiales bacterium]|nr:tetratricopeptide repeat protein [Candidatus Brocadiales bacterium]